MSANESNGSLEGLPEHSDYRTPPQMGQQTGQTHHPSNTHSHPKSNPFSQITESGTSSLRFLVNPSTKTSNSKGISYIRFGTQIALYVIVAPQSPLRVAIRALTESIRHPRMMTVVDQRRSFPPEASSGGQ